MEAWLESPHLQGDAAFLWHGFWFPRRTMSLEYADLLAPLVGWDKAHLSTRCVYWNARQIAVVRNAIILRPNLFRLIEGKSSTAKEDRTQALNRVLKLILSQIESNYFVSRTNQEWLFDMINHWKTMDEISGVPCKSEIETLDRAASQQIQSDAGGRSKFSTESFKKSTQRIRY